MTEFDVERLYDATVVDASGTRIGQVARVFLADRTGQPEWVTVKTGLFGTKDSFVPLAAARFDGDRLVVDASKDKVSGAPRVDEDGHISGQQKEEIYRYYGLTGTFGDQAPGYRTTPPAYETADTRTYQAAGGRDTAGVSSGDARRTDDARRPDDAMTRSEERLVTSTRVEEAGRVRVSKHVVTEVQTIQVEVRREEIRLEREPITDANRSSVSAGTVPDITRLPAEEQEIILYAERPVLSIETVAVERVRLGKELVTETETVSGEVRKEQIDLDDPTGTARER